MVPDGAQTLIVVNPKGGGGRAARRIRPIHEWLQTHAPHAVLYVGEKIAETRRIIGQLPSGSRVVVVGGDGTVFHCLPALLDRGHTLGVVALGSGNDLGRALGVHRLPWRAALLHAVNGSPLAMDLGQCKTSRGAWPFVSSLAAGFDAAVGHRAQTVGAWLPGLPRYLWATLQQLISLKTHRLRVCADGLAWYEGSCLFVSALNTPTYGAGMPAVPHAQIGDGRLDVVVAGDLNRRTTLGLLPRLLMGRHLSHSQVHTRPIRQVIIQSDSPVTMAADGEPLPDSSQWSIEVLPAALKVVSFAPNAATMPTS